MKFLPLTIFPLLFLTAHAAEPVVTIAGIQAVIDDGEKEFGGFKTYNSDKGLGITLIIRSPDKTIVAFDDEKASIKIGGAAAKFRFFGDMAFSKDRRTMRLESNAEGNSQISQDGTLKVTGELPITLATGKEETRSEPFMTAPGNSIKFPAAKPGMPSLKVKSSGKPKWGDDPFEIVLSTTHKADEYAGIRFYTKDGKPVDSEQAGSSWMGIGSKGSGEITYKFKAPQPELVLAVETWTGREDKKLKIELNAGLAIPK